MPTYVYWGEDDYQLTRAIAQLCADIDLDPQWLDFNYAKIVAATDQQIIDGFSVALTTPFGNGDRLTWLQQVTIMQKCGEPLLRELEAVCRHLPPSSHLVLSTSQKPDGRIKSTKLLQKAASFKEFSPLAAWDKQAIAELIGQVAREVGVDLTEDGLATLGEAVGSDQRQIRLELEKLAVGYPNQKITALEVDQLVSGSTSTSLQLVQAIGARDLNRSLALIADLVAKNEPPLRITATLINQFRTWLWVKGMIEAGERDDQKIAVAAELGNPKRLYFLRQEIKNWTGQDLAVVLGILLELEYDLKQGRDGLIALQTAIIQIGRAV
ncbi:MAG: DNA polymerase III subunit delta [Pseudanabaenaceae cyanobacterium bins.68]|nr:DNA polymerase III subunit delta [Pseudanabaenaceae cyanobacterium bins.68]